GAQGRGVPPFRERPPEGQPHLVHRLPDRRRCRRTVRHALRPHSIRLRHSSESPIVRPALAVSHRPGTRLLSTRGGQTPCTRGQTPCTRGQTPLYPGSDPPV